MTGEEGSDLSLVISTLDEGTALAETVQSVFEGTVVPDQLIVVDDGGADDSCSFLNRPEWQARNAVVLTIRRSGVAAARNIGAAMAASRNLMFLDAHCRLELDCVAQLLQSLEAMPDAVYSPAIRDINGDDFGCGARLIDPALRIQWLPARPESAEPTRLPIAPGGCVAMRRRTFARLGGFGRFRELGLEDIDFSVRAWRAGIDLLAAPSARLAHHFRGYPPYRLAAASRAFNVARVALIHFEGARRDDCLRTIIGTPQAAEVLVEAFASDWEEDRRRVSATSVRTAEAYFEEFGDWY